MSLGLALQNLFKSPGPGIVPGYPQMGLRDTSGDPGAPQPQAPSMQPQMSRGQLIAGILADALAGAAGRPAAFGQMLGQQREQQREEVQWQRRRAEGIQDYGEKQRLDLQYAKPAEQPAIVKLAAIVNDPTQPQWARDAAKANMDAQNNPVISLPGGGLGLRSTVTGMLGGGAPPPATLPPDFDFGGSSGTAPIGNMGIPSGAVSPGGSTPTTLSRADAAPFIKSLGPDGFQRWMAKHNIRLGN